MIVKKTSVTKSPAEREAAIQSPARATAVTMLVPGDPKLLRLVKKAAAENKKRYSKSKKAAVTLLKREGVLTASGRISDKYR